MILKYLLRSKALVIFNHKKLRYFLFKLLIKNQNLNLENFFN